MTLYVITESFFGNTRRIGEVIATELDVVLYGAASAPTDFADGDAVIVGAPTHNGRLPTPATREKALAMEGARVYDNCAGLLEWLEEVRGSGSSVRAAAFDTVVPGGAWFGSAAKRSVKKLKRIGFQVDTPAEHFLVAGTPPVLRDGELVHARDWAARLAERWQVG